MFPWMMTPQQMHDQIKEAQASSIVFMMFWAMLGVGVAAGMAAARA